MQKTEKHQLLYAITLASQLGFVIVFPIVGFIWLGTQVDAHFGTHPWMLLFFTFLGLIVMIYELFYVLLPLLRKHKQ